MKKFRQTGGFTLLEVLIVVAIIIIIAGIALPRFLGVSEQGRRARVSGDLRVLQTAIESYILNTNTVPLADGTNLEKALPAIVSNFAADFLDPFSSVNGNYKISSIAGAGGKKYYVAWSVGPDQKSDITSINDSGAIQGTKANDIYVTNGS